ncbi:MAG: arylsulfatase [Gemmatales bacterium]|nr:MAG: arylsulfatase [Gemmatales bacterium]
MVRTTLTVWLFAAAFATAAEKSLPNIIFLMADDLGSGDLGCYNKDSKIPTPNMDRLAAQGMRFTDAHTPSAVCTPTRYGVLTGRYAWRTRLKKGVLHGYDPLLIEPDRMTVASLLKKHGYSTGCVGKWHLGLGKEKPTDYTKSLRPGPNAVGFDYFFGIPASLDMPPYVFVENEKVVAQPTEEIAGSQMRRRGGGGFWRGGAIAPGFRHVDVLPKITEKAVAFIDRQTKEKPFFLYFPLSAPHTPWMPTEPFLGRSKAGPYGDFTVQVDATVGAVMEALDKKGFTENTLFIVTSDNGAHWLPSDKEKYKHLANWHYRGQKADIWEGGHRVAFIARWPGKIKPGTVNDATICLVDFLATCAEIVGEKLPENAGEDSFSILPHLLGKKPETERPPVVHHSGSGLFAIRKGDWKLIEGLGSGGFSSPKSVKPKPGDPAGQLYNLKEDLAESKNLYLEKPDIVKELQADLAAIRKKGRSR